MVWRDTAGTRFVDRNATYDFGNTLIGQPVTQTMTVRNMGAGKLKLASLTLASGDTVQIGTTPVADAAFTVEFTPSDLNSSEQAEFKMVFSPTSLKGDFLATLTLNAEGTADDAATATITLKGSGEKGACDLPDAIDFGKVPVGETLSYPVEFRNPTTVPARGSAGFITGSDALAFGYDPAGPSGEFDVAPRTTQTVLVTFSPTEKRVYGASVTLRGAGACPEKTVPVTGEGSDDVLTWTPAELLFGYVNPGSDAVKDVVFTNLSKTPITITNITATMPSDFGQKVAAGADATKFVVAGEGQSALHIACSPSGLGPRQATLTFDTPLRRAARGTVTLKCTGGGPKAKVTPQPTLGFGRVGFFPGNPTFSVNRKITVQNVGTSPPGGDPASNLFLGIVVDGNPGQFPLYELTPDPGTDADEFTVGLGSPYDSTKGLPAVAGSNYVDLLVTLQPKSTGAKGAKLVIHTNDASQNDFTVMLTADAQPLPPCNYQVTPASIDFGLVSPGMAKDLPVTVTNLGVNSGDVCYLSGIDLAAGTSPAYSIVGGPVVEKELQPQQSWQVVVRLTPPGPVPTTLTTLNGTLQFNATSPSKPQSNISLRAAIGPSCLAVTPDPQDFGTVKVGCNSQARTFAIYNVCSTPVTVNGVTMQSAGGQPAGGPNCAGGAACPEFFLTQTPSGTMTLNPASAPLQFQAKYAPIDVGSDSGAIALNVIQSGQTITYLVGLLGKGDTSGLQADTFTQDASPKADILLVVDDSGSMADKQANLANNFASFIQYAVSANVDYQMGVTTTTMSAQDCIPGAGCFSNQSKAPAGLLYRDAAQGIPAFLTPRTPNVGSTFSKMVAVGTDGSGDEQGLEAAVAALTPPKIANENAGFLRTDANLAIVVVSDAGDGSPQPLSYYQNRLVNVKGFNRLSMFTFNDIGPYAPAAPGNCSYDSATNTAHYDALVTYTGGIKDEICTTSWATTLQNLGRTTFGFRSQFFLNNTPDTGPGKTMDVKIDGVAPAAGAWSYDAASNSIKFNPTATPGPGQSLTVTYSTACF